MTRTMTRWDPFAELGELRGGIDRMFGDWLDTRAHARLPAIDVVRDHGDLVVRADMPGLKPEEVKVELDGTTLTVSGEHEESNDTNEKDYMRRERRYGSFYRALTVPTGVKADGLKATARDGVVEVRITLPSETQQERIQITPAAA